MTTLIELSFVDWRDNWKLEMSLVASYGLHRIIGQTTTATQQFLSLSIINLISFSFAVKSSIHWSEDIPRFVLRIEHASECVQLETC